MYIHIVFHYYNNVLLWHCLLLSWVVVYAEYISFSSCVIFVFLCIDLFLPPSCFHCLLSSAVWPVWPHPHPPQRVFKAPASAVLHMARPHRWSSMPFVPCVLPSSLLRRGHPSCSCLALFIPGWVLCGLLSSRGASCSSFCFSSLLFLRSPLPRIARDPYIHLKNLMPRLMKLLINILDSWFF